MRTWMAPAFGATITAEVLSVAGLYRSLRERGIWPHTAVRSVSARSAGPVEASLLGIDVGAPLLVVDSTMQDTTGTRVEITEQVHDGTRYTMELTVVES